MKALTCTSLGLSLLCIFVLSAPAVGAPDKPKPPVQKPVSKPTENIRELLKYDYGNQITRSEISIFSNGLVIKRNRSQATYEYLANVWLKKEELAALTKNIELVMKDESVYRNGNPSNFGSSNGELKIYTSGGRARDVFALSRSESADGLGKDKIVEIIGPAATQIRAMVQSMARDKMPEEGFGQAPEKNETTEVIESLANTDETRFNYCIKGTLTCRTLVLLKNKVSGQSANLFYNNFLSSERSSALTGYFLKNENENFRVYSDGNFNGKIEIDTTNDWDKDIKITFDEKGFPTAHELNLKVLGSTMYTIAELSFKENECTIKGIKYDSADSSVAIPVNVTYLRIN